MKSLENRYYHYRSLYLRGGSLRRYFCDKMYFITQVLHSCEIPLSVQIGKNIKFGHRGIGIVIHKDAVIGDNVQIMQNVTIGAKGGFAPVIQNGVLIGAGAVVLGKVMIGANAIIGANAVVTKDVLPDSIVIGVPAKELSYNSVSMKEVKNN